MAQTVAAVAIALFWCISAVGTTIGTAVGITSIATAVTAATSTPAEAGYRRGVGVGSASASGSTVARRHLGSVLVLLVGPSQRLNDTNGPIRWVGPFPFVRV